MASITEMAKAVTEKWISAITTVPMSSLQMDTPKTPITINV